METVQYPLINGLMDPTIYPHPCTEVLLVETHISWVLLTGLRAYKIKKPVDLGFVDFTTLKNRRYYCEEEVRLNRRLAPAMYLDVVQITGTVDAPRIGGDGMVIDYAVRMLQFDQDRLLSNVKSSELTSHVVDGLADQCAGFHLHAAMMQQHGEFGTAERVVAPVIDNFEFLSSVDESMQHQVESLKENTLLQFSQLRNVFENRHASGMIRECHGDLHLGNMFLLQDEVTIFDGIEFSEEFRWIDIINDIAFTVMDLQDRGLCWQSRRFLNRWLERTGDYDGLKVLAFYCSYRAVVRAKVDAIRMHQPHLSFSDQRHLANDCHGYLDLAEQYLNRTKPVLLITMGFSGSGKTTVSQQLLEAGDVIRIRSDVERKRLNELKPDESSDSLLNERIYTAEATARTYERLAELATEIIYAGYAVVVDATFLKKPQRDRFRQLADTLGISFYIIHCDASEDVLKQRIHRRQQSNSEVSEAGVDVLQQQLQNHDPLQDSELSYVVDANSESLNRLVVDRCAGGKS